MGIKLFGSLHALRHTVRAARSPEHNPHHGSLAVDGDARWAAVIQSRAALRDASAALTLITRGTTAATAVELYLAALRLSWQDNSNEAHEQYASALEDRAQEFLAAIQRDLGLDRVAPLN
jgi:hypothetical protein